MGTKTVFKKLSEIEPKSDTDHHRLQAMAHRARGRTGDEAAAKTHEHMIREIRSGHMVGSSRMRNP
jgi:hypothetical protein